MSFNKSSDDAEQLDQAMAEYINTINRRALTIVLLGGSGHLAKQMVIPTIFSLYCKNLLPSRFHLIGYARSDLDDKSFRESIATAIKGHEAHLLHNMTVQYDQIDGSEANTQSQRRQWLTYIGLGEYAKTHDAVDRTDIQLRADFINHCHYVQGKYDELSDYRHLTDEIVRLESQKSNEDRADVTGANRIFYLAIPPTTFSSALDCINKMRPPLGWVRCVVEKPFGSNLDDSKKLNIQIHKTMKEEEIYRVDHFLGKEMIQNIMAIRFGNPIIHEKWHKNGIQSIFINVTEDIGVEGRGSYFDESGGIIPDMIQNHLLQVLAHLLTREPSSLDDTSSEDMHKEKTRILSNIKPLTTADVVIGQYIKSDNGKKPGYTDDETVPKDSITATHMTAVLHCTVDEWSSLPIVLHCGKGFAKKQSYALITFKSETNNNNNMNPSVLYPHAPPNRLKIDFSSKPKISLEMSIKSPGISNSLQRTELELSKDTATELKAVPTAYERVMFEVLRGHHSLFTSSQEVEAAWTVVDSLMTNIKNEKVKPIPYKNGSHGPTREGNQLLKKHNVEIDLEKL